MSADRTTPDAAGTNGAEDEVWGAIGAFEQILEAMPDDTASLAALSHAYAQVGDHAKAVDYLLRLGNALLVQSDIASAEQLLNKLKPYEDDPNIQELMQRITQLSSPEAGGEGVVETPTPPSALSKISTHEMAALSSFKMADELSLAWAIMESGELTQDEYANVVQDLSDMSASDSVDTISVLHVLEARGYKNLEKIIENLAKECGTPFVSLTSYEFQWQAISLLPEQFCSRRGALAFELLGDDVLVAVMNPQDQQLRKDIGKIIGRKCHFYLALSTEFDKLLTRYREALEGDAEEK